MDRRSTALATVALLLAPVALPPGASRAEPPPAERPALLGAWTLNTELSEDARAKLRQGPGSGGPAGRAPGGGPRPGGGMGRGRMPSRAEMEAARDAVHEALAGTPRLTITEDAGALVLTAEDGSTRRLRPDGRKAKAEGGTLERKTEWQGPALVIETRTGQTTLRETLAREGARLVLTVRVDGPRGEPLELRRVYDPVLGP